MHQNSQARGRGRGRMVQVDVRLGVKSKIWGPEKLDGDVGSGI